MSTRNPSRPDYTAQKGLGAEDTQRLNTFMLDIAAALLPPGTLARDGNGETRFGRKGSLAIRANVRWYDHEAGVGGRNAIPLIRHLLKSNCEWPEAVAWAKQWLSAHHGTGSLTVETSADTDVREKQNAKFAQRALDEMVPIAGTVAETYLVKERGLAPPWPLGLGYWPDARSNQGEGALVAPLTNRQAKTVAVHLVFLDGRGRKSTLTPAKQSFRLTDREAAAGAVYRIDGEAPDPFTDPPADPADPEHLHRTTILCEGIEDALAAHAACPFSDILGMPGVGRLKHLAGQLNGDTVVVRDGDPAGSNADQAVIRGLDALLLAGARNLRLTDTPLDADANDILRTQGPDALCRLIIEAKPAQLSRDGDIQRLACMAPLDVTTKDRKDTAKRWDIPVRDLDRAVVAERNRAADTAIPDTENQTGPVWDESMWSATVTDIGAVLDEALTAVSRYIIAEEHELAVLCIWSLHTHLVHREDLHVRITPRLGIQAEAPDCGKSTVLDTLDHMSLRGKLVASTTQSAFFRIVSKYRPTVLIDEGETLFRRGHNLDLLSMINSGHSQGRASIDRVEELDGRREVVTYDCFGPVAIASIKKLPMGTTQSRCIVIQMKKARRHEQPEHMEDAISPELVEIRQKFARWCADLKALPTVQRPQELINRKGDNWRILLQLACLAGPRWWDLILKAARADVAREAPVEGTAIPLLQDIRAVFGTKARLSTEDLCRDLLALADPSGEWRRCNSGGEVSAYYLRDKLQNLLEPPGTQQWKEKARNVRGYLAKQFNDSFERYLDQSQPQPARSPKSASRKRRNTMQPTREHGKGADADAWTTDCDAETTSGEEHDVNGPARNSIKKGLKVSGTSGTSGTATNKTKDHNDIDLAKRSRMAKNSSGTASGTAARIGPVVDRNESPATVPDTVPDEFLPSGTSEVTVESKCFSKAPDVPDVTDRIRGKREEKTQGPINGLEQSTNDNPKLQSDDKMQGPKEVLW